MSANTKQDRPYTALQPLVNSFRSAGFWRTKNIHPITMADSKVINQIFGARAVREAQAKLARAEAGRVAAENAASMAQASNRAKSDSLANINHEIRTPMGAIAGLIHILMATNLDDRQKECLTAMRDSANALMTMINDQLDIDKIESRTLNLEHAPFNMPALLQQVVGLMSVKAQEKAIGLSLRYEDGLDKIFTGDGGRIRQIVTNLVGNAIKFTERGKVTVSCASRRNGKGENQISISVTDTGIGIAKYKTGVIFERFIQADPSIALKYGGTGLGLSISKALAESMGGSIAVTSVVGEGSVFTLHLPAELQVVSLQAAAR